MRFAILLALVIGCSPPPATKSGGGGTGAGDKTGGTGGGGGAGGTGGGPTNADCRLRVGLLCGPGKADGCTGGKTTLHVCVDETEQPGPPCEQEIAKQCPAGQIDACLRSPPAATHHLCVY